jgi:thiol-disulfide isomerase/thioredoxin
MRMKRNLWVLMAVVVLVGIALFQSFTNANQNFMPQEEAPKANFLAPSFALEGMDGQTYTVGGPREKALLINFWAAWCGPCHEEAPDLVRLHEEYGDQLDIYAVNVTKMDNLEKAKAFVEQYQFEFPVPLDIENKVAELYDLKGYPTTYLVDKNGVIREVIERMILPNDMKRIEQFIKE